MRSASFAELAAAGERMSARATNPKTGREAFNEKTAALQDKMWAHGVHISVGALWQARCDDPEELFRGADARMYEAKQAYYRRLAEVEG